MDPDRSRPRESRVLYNHLAPYYETIAEPFQGRVRSRGINLMAPSPGEDVLDIGCGTGRGLRSLQQDVGPNGRAVGIDIAVGMCRLAANQMWGDTPSTVICGDAVRLPVGTNTFDAVLASFTLELLDPRGRQVLLREVRRVLRPDGRICVIAPTTNSSWLIATLYSHLHERLPTLVDSHPLDVAATLRKAGLDLHMIERERALVIPIEIALARPAGHA